MPLNNELPSYESLLEFQEVYTRAIALAWQNAEFRSLLLSNAKLAFEQYFAYVVPWTTDISFFEPEIGSTYKGWNPATMKWDLPQSTITICVPDCPEQPDEITLALAMYNDAGPTYLFTCC